MALPAIDRCLVKTIKKQGVCNMRVEGPIIGVKGSSLRGEEDLTWKRMVCEVEDVKSK